MAEESTIATPLNTANKEIEKAKKGAPSYQFPSNLGQPDTELHSYIEFKVLKESNTRELTNDDLKKLEQESKTAKKKRGQPHTHRREEKKISPADDTLITSTSRVETNSTIRLFIPENVSMPTAAQYDSQTMGTIGATVTNFFGGSFGDLKDVGAGGNLAQSAKSEAIQTLGNFAGGGGGDVINQAVFGRAANAAKYLLFKGIDFRKFQFQYNLVPHSKSESEELSKIIKTFRQAMLPNIVSVGFYDIPQSFEIKYVIQYINSEGKLEQLKVPTTHLFKKCNLEECNVTYGANGRFTLTKDGYPANIQLSLTFSENEQVTRDDIPDGF